ncbi:hypothetical protein FSB65_21945 [Paraburkholderia sp. JPY418]|uniref:Uncharacterized protein n=1 Tax=Paraburkholderia youngii TaxID=2782701 RepID=A0ABX2NYM7_9BURK|nr:hypothetical protein [Paraburkholderia youngii]NVI09265.1 hypothetical protein [Paraburkholderia youngii]
MTTLTIHDLPRVDLLDRNGMHAIRGGLALSSVLAPTEPCRLAIPTDPCRSVIPTEPCTSFAG